MLHDAGGMDGGQNGMTFCSGGFCIAGGVRIASAIIGRASRCLGRVTLGLGVRQCFLSVKYRASCTGVRVAGCGFNAGINQMVKHMVSLSCCRPAEC
jgi:hypothetical protein